MWNLPPGPLPSVEFRVKGMDDKTPRQIREEIVAAFASKGENSIDELDRMVLRLERGSKPDKE
jgi:hypothetical protein